MLEEIFRKVKTASYELSLLDDETKNSILNDVADAIIGYADELLKANQLDLDRMEKSNPLYDRLQLTPQRLEGIASDMRNVSRLPSPLGRVMCHRVLDNGLDLKKVSVPFGVIGVIYEARPNVTFDVFSLCLKSGNASVLKGGKDADNSNKAAMDIIKSVLNAHHINPDISMLLPATHEATAEMLKARGFIDICIPRGGKRLIEFVRDNARIPVIETGAGVVHTYFDRYGNLSLGAIVINNAKTRRVSVCNALDCLIVHASRLADLPELCALLEKSHVALYADTRAKEALQGHYPTSLLFQATDDSFGTEYMDYAMTIRTVDNMQEAVEHIRQYGSGHSESIITDDDARAEEFQKNVDASCVYVNAPTSFTDGAQFGMGAEIGISTQKLGPRGPMALEEMTTYKWMIKGQGQIRP